MFNRFTKIISAAFLVCRNIELLPALFVKSHLTLEERLALFKLSNSKEHILEIGSYLGASACCFGAAVKRHGRGKVFCIDTWNNDAMSEGNKDTFSEFKRNTSPYKKVISPVRGLSTDVVTNVASEIKYLDLFFIDGDHSYEGVKADWESYKKFLRSGTIVVFHDWGWADGVQRVIEEDAKPIMQSFDFLPNMWWGTVK